ncbi:MAG: tryptophan--tRNA ligase [Holosporales bacterium]|jgi:tryptophanyl-tRNA synthetase|nr:tryptophan--tRNA ligase [Holosporales bacterium]
MALYDQEKRKVVITGDRPTGPLHLGHYVGSLQSRVEMQDRCDCFVMIADTQALSDHFENPELVARYVREVFKDYISVGISPTKSTIFVQSMVPELFELTSYYMNLVTVARLERNPTVKSEIQQKGFDESVPAGFLCYPVSQAADITAFKASLVPVGEDQLPLIEITNEIVRRFNRIYDTDVLMEAQAVLGKIDRLVGIDGKAKASKSMNNAISLSDSPEMIKEKVFSMYTDPNHIKASDPGKVEGNVVFAYLKAFFEDDEELQSMKKRYERGGLGDVVLKSLLNETLQKFLAPIREKRRSIKESDILDQLEDGTKRAREVASMTIEQVRDAMSIKYWAKEYR